MGVDVVSFHVITINKATLSRCSIGISVRVPGWFAKVSRKGSIAHKTALIL